MLVIQVLGSLAATMSPADQNKMLLHEAEAMVGSLPSSSAVPSCDVCLCAYRETSPRRKPLLSASSPLVRSTCTRSVRCQPPPRLVDNLAGHGPASRTGQEACEAEPPQAPERWSS